MMEERFCLESFELDALVEANCERIQLMLQMIRNTNVGDVDKLDKLRASIGDRIRQLSTISLGYEPDAYFVQVPPKENNDG